MSTGRAPSASVPAGPGAVPFVCPRCRAALSEEARAVLCGACGARYPRPGHAYADFAGAEAGFDDWWAQSTVEQHRWLAEEAPREEEYEVGLARRFLMPLLARLDFRPGERALLSAGCGLAADVDALNDAGFHTFGIDCGNRVLRWSARRYQARLARADIRQMPFPENAFDLVVSLNTIEHIGVIGDTTSVAADYAEQRMDALRSLLRVTKPGGYIVLSGLSRTIPFDFGHIQGSRFVRIHSPWEKFLLSYGDVERLCRATGDVESTQPLPIRGFFSWTRLRHYVVARPLLPVVDWLFGSLPPAVYGSALCPFWIILARRRRTR